MNLKISTPQAEGIYQGSKFLKHMVLCDADELRLLFESLNPFSIYPLTHISDGMPIDVDTFLDAYRSWIEALKSGCIPKDEELKRYLAAAFVREEDALWKQEIPKNRFLIKMAKPCVQAQAHFFTHSRIDNVFRPMTMGPNAIFWGLHFSFPQIYQDPKTMQLLEVEESLNAELFHTIKLWTRENTRATPFVVDGKRINVPIRLGKNCFEWIHQHPQLKAQKIGVYGI